MPHLKRALALGVLTALLLSAADVPKPKVRAITAFITIDAKSYPVQIAGAVKFLSQMRDAVKAAGYDVAGIRISTQPFPEYTRGLRHDEALKVLHGIDDLAGKLRFAPNIGPAMVQDTDDSAPIELITEVLATPGNRLNANIVTAGDDGIHWNAVRQAAVIIRTVGARSPRQAGKSQFCRHRHAEAIRAVLSRCLASRRAAQFRHRARSRECGDGRLLAGTRSA